MRYTFILLLAISFGAAGQQIHKKNYSDNEAPRNLKPVLDYKQSLNFSVFSMAQIDNTFQVGYERRVAEHITVMGELGYIFASSYFSKTKNASGFVIRPSVRFFLNQRNTFYVSPQFYYKSATNKVYDWLNKEVNNGVSSYSQLQDFKYRRIVTGANFLWGGLIPIIENKAFLDLYIGIGLRHKTHKIVGEPNSEYRNDIFTINNGQDSYFANLPMGLRFSYNLK